MFLAEMMLSDSTASAAPSSTSALFLMRPDSTHDMLLREMLNEATRGKHWFYISAAFHHRKAVKVSTHRLQGRNYSPTTSSRTSFQCSSLPFSWMRVTVILRWIPCKTGGWRVNVGHSLRRVKLFVSSLSNKEVNATLAGWRRGWDVQYLVQEVSAMAGQSSTVIHYSWDVPAEHREGEEFTPKYIRHQSLLVSRSDARLSFQDITWSDWLQNEVILTVFNSLSGGLQLADLKPDQQVVLAHTLAQVGLGDGVQLGGRNWTTNGQMVHIFHFCFSDII